MKYKYKNLVIIPYWNIYKVFYDYGNGNKELLCWKQNKTDAYKAGKLQVDYLNAKAKEV